MSVKFVADVGGTNIRLAQFVDGKLVGIKKYLCNDFETIQLAIESYFGEFPELQFESGCIAIACPVTSDWIQMTNHTWAFSASELQANLGLKWLSVINDFTSVAFSLPGLSDSQKVQIGGDAANPTGNIAVFGAGTGLGVDHLTWTDKGWKSLDGEGGHVDFSPVDETDVVIWRFLTEKYGRASTEEALSGRGLLQIYQAIARSKGENASLTEPAQVTNAALDGSCDIAHAALVQFCRIMGTFAGNLALNLAASGGVYIGGGIASRFIDFIKESDFRSRFESKGVMSDFVKDFPVFIITEPDHGLLGAAAYLQQNIEE